MSTAELNSSQRKSKYISMYETVTALGKIRIYILQITSASVQVSVTFSAELL